MSQARTTSGTLRVLHVIASMAAETGGPPAVCAGLAAALANRGHQITVATVADPGQTPVPLSPNVQLHSLSPDGSGSYRSSKALSAWLQIHASEFDLLHLHSIWQFPTYAAAKAARQARKPYVVLLNGMLDHYSVTHRSSWKKRLYWFLRERRIESGAAAIHCLNRAEIRRAVPWIAAMPKFVIGNAIAAAELAALPPRGQFRHAHPEIGDRPLVLFLSRLHPKKGLDRLIPAWKAFVERQPDARFVIAGTGDADYVASLQRLIEQNGLADRVLMVGQLVGPQKWQALVDADLFVLPSHQEGFSMAITEALAAGCTPVVTEECNFDELHEHHCGVLVQGGDMTKFVHEAASLLADPARRASLAAAGRKLVGSQFTWEKIAEQMDQVYRHALAGAKFAPNGDPVWRTPRP